MPEGLEAEIWCRSARDLVGRWITELWCDQRVAPDGLADTLVGAEITAVDRIAKVVRLITTNGTLGMHFGMTGRLEVDGHAPIAQLEYASGADRPEWDRLRLFTRPSSNVAALRMNDPRRLGKLSLDAVIDAGPDLLTLTGAELAVGVAGRRMTIKAALLDQTIVGGLGNLCADEVLFWSGVAPERTASELTEIELDAVAVACRTKLPEMLLAGGSTHGTLSPEVRAAPMPCPVDGMPLQRTKLAGRTAVWCPHHQPRA
ncbi:MAG: DNA-formamidopyrimidine glycosylase family protein [Ilumatobacter sp.]